jgi:uncharacterized protein YkwD
MKYLILAALGLLFPLQVHAYTPEDILTVVNKSRSTPLVMNPELSKAAQDKANLLLACKCFSHTVNDKRFFSHIQDHNIPYWIAGENLALGFSNVFELNQAWLNSPTHRANILAPYTETGIAVSKGMYQGEETTYVVQLFILPLTK